MSLETFSIHLDITIRHARHDDLRDLEWFGLLTDYRETIERAYQRAQQGKVAFLVAEVNDFPIGQVCIDFVKSQEEGIGIIWALRVLYTMQNLGVGTRLIQAAERCILERGLHTAELGVEKDNPNAKRLYERLGYATLRETIETWQYTTPAGETRQVEDHEWIMRKQLKEENNG